MSEKDDAMWGADAGEYIAYQKTEIARLHAELDVQTKWALEERAKAARFAAAFAAQLEAHNYAEVLEIARKALAKEGK